MHVWPTHSTVRWIWMCPLCHPSWSWRHIGWFRPRWSQRKVRLVMPLNALVTPTCVAQPCWSLCTKHVSFRTFGHIRGLKNLCGSQTTCFDELIAKLSIQWGQEYICKYFHINQDCKFLHHFYIRKKRCHHSCVCVCIDFVSSSLVLSFCSRWSWWLMYLSHVPNSSLDDTSEGAVPVPEHTYALPNTETVQKVSTSTLLVLHVFRNICHAQLFRFHVDMVHGLGHTWMAPRPFANSTVMTFAWHASVMFSFTSQPPQEVYPYAMNHDVLMLCMPKLMFFMYTRRYIILYAAPASLCTESAWNTHTCDAWGAFTFDKFVSPPSEPLLRVFGCGQDCANPCVWL